MPVRHIENQYHGVNAHLHSYLQQHGEWRVFHGAHISDLRAAIQAVLPPEAGYFVLSERSLQVVRDEYLPGIRETHRTIPVDEDAQITLDLNAIYNLTFASNRAFGSAYVDYAELPERFDLYMEEDQRRIRAVMARAVAAQQSGDAV